MNLNSLWQGSDYAYYQSKGRGETYRRGALRVRVIRTFGEVLYGNTRETGFADVLLIDEEGEPKEDDYGRHITRKVKARDIAMLWEQYEEEHADREVERLEREARYAEERRERDERYAKLNAERIERERINAERRAAELAEFNRQKAITEQKIYDLLYLGGIDKSCVTSISDYSITLDRRKLLNEQMEEKSEPVNG
jgi:hypothetical protein